MDDQAPGYPEPDPTVPMPSSPVVDATAPLPAAAPTGSPLPPPPPPDVPPVSTTPPPPSAVSSSTVGPSVDLAPPDPLTKSTPAEGWAPGSEPQAPPTVARNEPSAPTGIENPWSSGNTQEALGVEKPSASFASPDSTIERSSLNPKAPPSPPVGSAVPDAKVKTKPGLWGWRALVAFVAGGLLTMAAFTTGRFTAPVEEAAPSPTSVLVDLGEDGDEARAGTLPPITDQAGSGIDPAVAVAQRLGPSVVQVETDLGLGSGVVYRSGFVITNNHVIEDAQQVRVRSSDGRTLDATIVGTDPATDIAVLSVTDGESLPVADLAKSSEVQVGQLAVAIGSPFQLQQTVTAGIVSALNRPVPSRAPQVVVAMIQTDAPINPGNSGGALANRQGQVIGINTSIRTDSFSTTNAGVGFAVPIDTASRIADLLVDGRPIEPGFLGVGGGQNPSSTQAGVEIESVSDNSAAEAAGVEVGDRVLSIDGAPVTSLQELAGLVLARQAGDQVILRVVREGQTIELEVELGLREP